jgi:hypothetical protein
MPQEPETVKEEPRPVETTCNWEVGLLTLEPRKTLGKSLNTIKVSAVSKDLSIPCSRCPSFWTNYFQEPRIGPEFCQRPLVPIALWMFNVFLFLLIKNLIILKRRTLNIQRENHVDRTHKKGPLLLGS